MTDTKQTEPEITVTLRKSDLNYAINLIHREWDRAAASYANATEGIDVNCPHCLRRLDVHHRKVLIDRHKHVVAVEASLKRVQAAAKPAPTPEPAAPAAEPTAKKTNKVRGTK